MDNCPALANNVPAMSVNDQKVVRIWKESMQLDGKHYCLDMPFQAENPNLPNNIAIAQRRLSYLEKRLPKNPDLLERYKAGIEDLLIKGCAEKVDDTNVDSSLGMNGMFHTTV